jgi:CO dehydrogenase/acetyl-CoA synthase beta subunit
MIQNNQSNEDDVIDVPKIDEFLQEEEQSYVLNGILVESKYETEEEKQKQKQRLIKQYLQKPSIWVPNNMQEFLFCSDFGVLNISEEAVKAYSMDFETIMKIVYNELKLKYETTLS